MRGDGEVQVVCDACGATMPVFPDRDYRGGVNGWLLLPDADLCPGCWHLEADEAGEPRAVRTAVTR